MQSVFLHAYRYVICVHTHVHIYTYDLHGLPVDQLQGFQAPFWCAQRPSIWYRKSWGGFPKLEFVVKEVKRSHCYRFLVPNYCQDSVRTACSLGTRGRDWGVLTQGKGRGTPSHPTTPAKNRAACRALWETPVLDISNLPWDRDRPWAGLDMDPKMGVVQRDP